MEVCAAIWSCGSVRAHGLYGFSFRFMKRFWERMKDNICNFVEEFFDTHRIPNGCNSSFITLIPKVDSPSIFKDYRPISLTECNIKLLLSI